METINLKINGIISAPNISQHTTATWISPPSGVYFAALSRMLNRASVVHFRSWVAVTVSGQSTVTAIFSVLRSAEYRPAPQQGYHRWPAASAPKQSPRLPAVMF